MHSSQCSRNCQTRLLQLLLCVHIMHAHTLLPSLPVVVTGAEVTLPLLPDAFSSCRTAGLMGWVLLASDSLVDAPTRYGLSAAATLGVAETAGHGVDAVGLKPLGTAVVVMVVVVVLNCVERLLPPLFDSWDVDVLLLLLLSAPACACRQNAHRDGADCGMHVAQRIHCRRLQVACCAPVPRGPAPRCRSRPCRSGWN